MSESQRLPLRGKDRIEKPTCVWRRTSINHQPTVRAIGIDQDQLAVHLVGQTTICRGDIVVDDIGGLISELCLRLAVPLQPIDLADRLTVISEEVQGMRE